MAFLQIDNLQDQRILSTQTNPLSLQIEKQTCVFLKGANGSGKTTLLRMVAGLEKPEKGNILLSVPFGLKGAFWGTKLGIKQIRSIKTYFDLCETEKCYVEKSFTKTDDYSDQVKTTINLNFVYDVLWKQFDCLKHITPQCFIDTLSSGQQMVIRFLGILLQNKSLWLFDEPTRFFDESTENCFWDLVKQHQKNGGTCIIAVHEKNVVLPNLDPICYQI